MKRYLSFLVIAFVYQTTVDAVFRVRMCPLNCEPGQFCEDADSGCPLCKVGYWGRQCEHAFECKSSVMGEEYEGCKNTTVTGKSCQLWRLNAPHDHDYGHLPENYCRNPDMTSDGPWCYTTSADHRWEYCGIPSCDEHCPAPHLILFGRTSEPPAEGLAVNTTLEVTGGCGPGTKGRITCQENKIWTHPTDCEDINWCERPHPHPNSTIDNVKEEYHYNETVTVSCHTGMEVHGADCISCQANKTWGLIPHCTAVQCPLPILRPGSHIQNQKNGSYLYQDIINITCSEGYMVNGQHIFTCQSDRTWSGDMPNCDPVSCPNPPLKSESHITNPKTPPYVYLDQVTIVCNAGYSLDGRNNITCTASGTWSTDTPSCKPVQCPKPTNLPDKASIVNLKDQFFFKDTITLSCEEGYEMKGVNKASCQADKTWGTLPACTRKQCVLPADTSGYGSVDIVGDTAFDYAVIVQCPDGFYPALTVVVCHEKQQWSQTFPTCAASAKQVSTTVTEDKSNNHATSIAYVSLALSFIAIGTVVVIFFRGFSRKQQPHDVKIDDISVNLPKEVDESFSYKTLQEDSKSGV